VRAVLVSREPTGFTARALGAHPGVALQIAAPTDPLPADADVVFVEDTPAASLPAARVTVWLGETERSGFAVSGIAQHPIARGAATDWMRYVDPSAIHIAASRCSRRPDGAPGLVARSPSQSRANRGRTDDARARIRSTHLGPRLDVAFLHFDANVVDAAQPTAGAVAGVLSANGDARGTSATARFARIDPSHGAGEPASAFACLLAEGLFTHLSRRRR
jgi:hypothetical protein